MTSKTIAAAMLAVAAGAAVALVARPPALLGDLDRLERAQQHAQRASAAITRDLGTIAANLRLGAGLSRRSAHIRALTARQRASLQELAVLLRTQKSSLAGARSALGAARRHSKGLAALTRRGRALLARTLVALRDLALQARAAATDSAALERAARYGARLAEDSAEGFGP